MAVICPVILCGGSGTRLWPLSRQSMPKQFLNLIGDNSLFQQAAQRVSGSQFAKPLVITSHDYRFIAAQQLADIGMQPIGVVLEPSAKNTAPAILAAAEFLYQQDADAMLLVMPSDHYIPEQQALGDLVLVAKSYAEAGAIATFGIQPDRPETGYGYIERGEALSDANGYGVVAFHEKPDQATARAMLASGTYLWNSGLFLARCQTLLAIAETFVPDMLASVRKSVSESKRDLDFLRLGEVSWQNIKADSIDYAIMEKAENLMVFPFLGRWSDLGDWQSLRRELAEGGADKDQAGNILIGNASQIGSQSSFIWADNAEQVVTTVGMEDAIVIAMKDAVLVINAAHTQDVKQAVDLLETHGYGQAHEQTRHFRPWGWFETLVLSNTFQVRSVHLLPYAKMSMQTHQQRSENWVVVSGEAQVKLDNIVVKVSQNQSIDIPAGTAHQLINAESDGLTIIEVRTGDYLGDDDVERM